MNTPTIMVQVADRAWTRAALHLSCALARGNGSQIILVRMIPMVHPGFLGTELGMMGLGMQDVKAMQDYEATAEDYGVPFSTQVFQYVTLAEALEEAAEHFGARVVFATLPQYRLRFWRTFLLWRLERKLQKQGRKLYTLEKPADFIEATPSITVLAEGEESPMNNRS